MVHSSIGMHHLPVSRTVRCSLDPPHYLEEQAI